MNKYKIILLATIFLLIGCGAKQKDKDKETVMEKTNLEQDRAIITTQFGDIELEFFDDIAPKHVESFKLHAKNGYYDGTTFHRVIPGFMIQGGDPNTKTDNKGSWGMGGPGYNVKAEFSSRSHLRGIVSMARAMDPDSAGSQFFIMHKDSTFLDNEYTVFGEVIKGIKVADKVVSQPRTRRDLPLERIEITIEVMD